MHLTREDRFTVSHLNEQIRLAVSGLQVETTDDKGRRKSLLRLRLRLEGNETAACELWGESEKPPGLRRLWGIPAGVGIHLRLVDKAIENAGLDFPRKLGKRRADWHRLPAADGLVWVEIALFLPQPAE